jgi:probable F420-dependent oxidoreductase
MQLGLVTPVVTLNPRAHNEWERSAGVDEVVAIAQAADRLGYHHLTASEHVAVPAEAARRRGGRYWDPLATLGYLAAATTQVRLATHVLVLGYHHPLALAKRYGTLDMISGGRLILGVGVGTLAEEFELLGASYADRGRRADDALRALRAALGHREPSYAGEHYRFSGLLVDPHAVQPRVPIWVGGQSERSLRRAVALGDGWVPVGLEVEDLADLLVRRRSWPEHTERGRPLDVILHPSRLLDPAGDPAGVRDVVAAYRAAGATHLNVRLRHDSLPHCLEQMEAMVGLL